MKICGWDAGKSGSMALYSSDSDTFEFFDNLLLPDREHDIRSSFLKLLEFEPDVILTEATIRPINLVQHTGQIIAVGRILQTEVILLNIARWKKTVTGRVSSDKQLSIDTALKFYPNLELVKPRCKVPSHDRAEAALFVKYYLMTNSTGKNP